MACNLSDRRIKRILIQCPETIRNAYPTAPGHIFETVDTEQWIRISVLGGEFRRVNNHVDTPPSLMFGSTSPLLEASRANRSFEGSINSCPAELYWLLQDISEVSISTNWGQLTPVSIRDYATPETADVKTAIAAQLEPFTARSVMLTLSEPSPIVGKHPSYTMPGGFKYKMQETALRLV